MKNPYFEKASQALKETYHLDMIHDVLLGKSNRIICYAETIDPQNVFLNVISNRFIAIGLEDKPSIRLDELLSYYDPNNKYAEVAGIKKHKDYVYHNLYEFTKESSTTFPILTPSGRYWITMDMMPVEHAQHLVAYFIYEVTEGMNAEEINYEKSHRDALTGLFNKYTLDFHYGERYMLPDFHVMYLDLDDFKPINDTHGHALGNEYLMAFAKVLISHQKGYNQFYRLGGDEFVGLFWDTDEQVKSNAQKIIEETRQLRFYPDERGITVSIGVMKATKRHDVIRKADKILYEVKSKGKNQFEYVVEM
jgi:diguanylate cyclase (GGDEF)-like protein